jgi:hypothetical protein
MKTISRQFRILLIALGLALGAVSPGCATVGPVVVKCGLQDISIAASDYAEIASDIQSKNWIDLAKVADRIGWATIDCVLGDQVKQNPDVKPNVDEFRRLHSVEFRAAGASACNQPSMPSPGIGSRPVAGRGPDRQFSYLGESPGAALTRCEHACGGAALAPPSGCVCRRGLSWLAAR